MGKKRPADLRRAEPRRRRRGDVRLPDAVHVSQREPSWMRADEGVQQAAHIRAVKHAERSQRTAQMCSATGKRRFATELDAAKALGRTQQYLARIDPEKRREQRYYPCTFCDGFHMTSQPRRERPA